MTLYIINISLLTRYTVIHGTSESIMTRYLAINILINILLLTRYTSYIELMILYIINSHECIRYTSYIYITDSYYIRGNINSIIHGTGYIINDSVYCYVIYIINSHEWFTILIVVKQIKYFFYGYIIKWGENYRKSLNTKNSKKNEIIVWKWMFIPKL